jgi:hypothetical protein
MTTANSLLSWKGHKMHVIVWCHWLDRLIWWWGLRLVFGLAQISAGTLAILTEVFYGSPQSLLTNAGIVPQLGDDHFLPNPFQFMSSYHILLYCLDTEIIIKWPTTYNLPDAIEKVCTGWSAESTLWTHRWSKVCWQEYQWTHCSLSQLIIRTCTCEDDRE